MITSLPLEQQPVGVLVAFYKHLAVKVDNEGNVNPFAVELLSLIQKKGYKNIRKLIAETK
jgi:hypothetical protein